MTGRPSLLGHTVIGPIDEVLGPRNGMRGQVVGYVIAAVLDGACFALLVPVLRALFGGRAGEAVPWMVAVCCCAAASGVVSYVVGQRAYRVGIDLVSGGAKHKIGEHAAHLPLGWFSKRNVGRLSALITESTAVLAMIPGLLISGMIRALVTPLTVVTVVAFVDWRMAVAMTAFVPLGVVAYRRLSRVAEGGYTSMGDSDEDVSARVVEYAQAQMVLRSAGLTEKTWGRLDETLHANRNSVVRLLDANDRPLVHFKIVVQAGFATVVAVATLLGTAGSVNPADLIAVLFLAVRFMEPLGQLGGGGAEGFARGRTDLHRIRDFLALPTLPEPATPIAPTSTDVATEQLRFGYGDRPVLEDITLDVPTGTLIAVVGPSGAGKSTLTRLIARFWDPDAGVVRFGDVDVRDIGSRGVMERLAIVSQDVYLFDDTIWENVRLGKPDATEAEILLAAKAARLDEVVQRLPGGWSSRVGEGGGLLSGGERQRVSIARALLKDAPVVLLDEMTSALDAENERAITGAITEIIRDRTVLVVAHRLSTIRGADQILYLENGRIAEMGPPDDLIAADGKFAALWAARTAAENWQLTRPTGTSPSSAPTKH